VFVAGLCALDGGWADGEDRALDENDFYKQDRVMRLLREQRLFQLAPRGLTSAELASRMGISQRSAQRDIVALESELEMPFVKQGNRYAVIEGYFLAPIGFSVPEAVAMLISARLMARFADRFNPFAEAAYEKIGTVLPASVRAALSAAADSLGAKRRDDSYVRVFSALARAWAERRKVRLTYTMDRTFSRVVWPLFLEPSLSGHAVYLIAWEEKRGVPRSYRLERVSEAEVLEERFDPPLGFSLGQMLAHSWGIWSSDGNTPAEVRMLFSASVARRVRETVWHPSQRLVELADGRVQMSVLVSSLIEVRPWILGWGGQCEVLEPAELRESIAGELRQAAEQYAPLALEASGRVPSPPKRLQAIDRSATGDSARISAR
jgi:predicted DNA-binding transcriptional regulator YafY